MKCEVGGLEKTDPGLVELGLHTLREAKREPGEAETQRWLSQGLEALKLERSGLGLRSKNLAEKKILAGYAR